MNWIKKVSYIALLVKKLGKAQFYDTSTYQINKSTIRLFGGMRDQKGISRIGWIDIERSNPLKIKGICEYRFWN